LHNTDKVNKVSVKLTPPQERQFCTGIKMGIYKELHRKGLLSDIQLTRLTLMQNR